MKRQIFPLQTGIAYRTVRNERGIITHTTPEGYGLILIDGVERPINTLTGEQIDGHSVEDYWIEEGFYQLRSGEIGEIKLIAGGIWQYPFQLYIAGNQVDTLTHRGYSVSAEHPSANDIIRPAPRPVINYPKRNQTRAPITPATPDRTYNPLTNWREHCERITGQRIASGEFQPTPIGFPIKRGTGVHLSTNDPHLLAYYPTQRHWERRVPQQIKAGRYLKQYLPHLSDDEIRTYAGLVAPTTLRVYTRWQDMLHIYIDLDESGIVSSCMSKDCWQPMHPLMVYDQSDVILLAIYQGETPIARALCNKNTNEYPMIYGQWEKALPCLTQHGYKHGSLNGAIIRSIPRYIGHRQLAATVYPNPEDDHKRIAVVNNPTDYIRTLNGQALTDLWDYATDPYLLMPYIDGHRELDRSQQNSTYIDITGVSGKGYTIRIDHDASIPAKDYDNARAHPEEEDEDLRSCENCDDTYSEGDGYWLEIEQIEVCPHCYHHRTLSLRTRRRRYETVTEDFAYNNAEYVDGEYYEDTEALNDWGYCYSDYHEEWLYEDDCVFVADENDYYRNNEINDTIVWDEAEGEYITRTTYEERYPQEEETEEQAA